MATIPTENEVNAVSGLVVAITALVGLVIRAIEKSRMKRKLKERIRNGEESIFDEEVKNN